MVEIGKAYRIQKPENINEWPVWVPPMNRLNGKIITVEKIRKFEKGKKAIRVIHNGQEFFINEIWLKPVKVFVELNGRRSPVALPYDEAQAIAERIGGTICTA